MNKILLKISFACALVFSAQSALAQTIFTLDTCKARAIENNYKLRNADLDIEMAKQTRKEAFTKYFPQVEALGFGFIANRHTVRKDITLDDIVKNSPIDIQTLSTLLNVNLSQYLAALAPYAKPMSLNLLKNGKTASVMAMQPVFMGGQIINGNKLAKVGEEASVLQRQLSVDEIDDKTEQYFWQIVSLKEKMKTIRDLQKQLERLHKDVSAFVSAGVTNRNDLLRVELKQQELESNTLKVENGISISKMLLAQHIGAPSQNFEIAVDSFSMPLAPLKYYVDAAEAAQNRTETKLLDKNVEASHLRAKIESGKRLPSVGIGGGYVYHDFPGQTNTFVAAFATIKVPISDWWGGTHAYKRAKLNAVKAENERQNSVEMLAVEVQKTWNELQESYNQIVLANKSIVSSKENLRLNTDYYNAGIATLSDLLDAQSLLQQSRDQYAEACADYQVKLLRYKQVTR